MTSTAISAQGTKLFIETGAGVAKNITGIAPGNPTIITIAGHGIPNGNVSALSGIVGTIGAALNAKSLVVTNVTPDTFAVQVDTTGLAYGNGGIATPVAYTRVSNVKSFNGFDGASSEIDVTNLDSTAKEVRLGLQDFGKLSFDINPDLPMLARMPCARPVPPAPVSSTSWSIRMGWFLPLLLSSNPCHIRAASMLSSPAPPNCALMATSLLREFVSLVSNRRASIFRME